MRTKYSALALALSSVVLAPACGGVPAGVNQSSQALSIAPFERFAPETMVVGTLAYGQTSDPVSYVAQPRFRAFSFTGATGDQVRVTITSPDGLPVAYVLDDHYKVLARSAAPTIDDNASVEIQLKLASTGHFLIAFRNEDPVAASFVVRLEGSPVNPNIFSCTTDSDCVAVPKAACCPNGTKEAVNASMVDAYKSSFTCSQPHMMCPMYLILDKRVAECHANRCEMVQLPQNTESSATPAAHRCGGIAGLACPTGQTCVDDPSDSCNPARGGRDCSGICQAADPRQ